MELRQLEYVVAITEERTFTRAATRARVAQPAISQQVRRLERELGRRLFDRSSRPVRLTPAGAAFLPFARAALDAAADGRDAVASVEGILAGRLRIGTVQAPPPFLSDLLGEFHADYPGVEITLRWEHAEALAGQVSSGDLDAAVIGLGGQRIPAGVATRLLTSEPMVIAVGSEHPLAGRGGVALAAVRDQPFVTLPAGSGLRALVESACLRAGFAPVIRAETDDLYMVAELVKHGLGIALLPESIAKRQANGLDVLRVRRPSLRRRLALAWPRSQPTAAGVAFRRFATRFANARSSGS